MPLLLLCKFNLNFLFRETNNSTTLNSTSRHFWMGHRNHVTYGSGWKALSKYCHKSCLILRTLSWSIYYCLSCLGFVMGNLKRKIILILVLWFRLLSKWSAKIKRQSKMRVVLKWVSCTNLVWALVWFMVINLPLYTRKFVLPCSLWMSTMFIELLTIYFLILESFRKCNL